ncbi:MAG: UbiH/UbiF/VisC/COQ6 family ubiquinone biosynthesis hydroxylase [Alphaproteobacteria bacterium]|nr:UbiH/UbiF/VisC/COQ6 family ubiquinone biosynthesis hydroxylase [Alphaproteobacteria bacterium]
MAKRTETVIIGGGLIGLTLGIALGRSGIETIVVERESPKRVQAAAFDGRTSAIAYGSRRVLRGLGLWEAMAGGAEPILDIRVADGASPLFLHYDHRDVGTEPFGHILENRHLRQALFASAANVPALQLEAPAEVRQLERDAHGVRAHLDSGETIAAQIAIAADGRKSPMREAAGIRSLRGRYPQTAIVCTVRHEKSHHGVAVEHFLPAGPFAILPMTENRSSIVWTERSELAPALLKLEAPDFLRELVRRFGDHLGGLQLEGGRWSYPLSLVLAERYLADRLALIGDAAHGIHPIAGQGLNLGFRDVASLAECLVDAHRLGLDLGRGVHLERYQRLRRFDGFLMAAMTDGLNRLFSNDLAPLRIVRDAGLGAVNRLPPLKRQLMRHAMGMPLGGWDKGPRLVRGLPL